MLQFNRRTLACSIVGGFLALSLAHVPLNSAAQSGSSDKILSYPAAGAPVQATVNVENAYIDFDFNLHADFAIVRISGPDLYAVSKRVENADRLSVDLLNDLNVSGYVSSEIDKEAVAGLEYLPSGRYTFEMMVYSSDGVRHTTRGSFKVDGGNARLVPPKAAAPSSLEEVTDIRRPGPLQRFAGSILDFVFPSAHAGENIDDFVGITDFSNDDHTRLNFFQTTPEATRFSIQNFEGDFKILEGTGTAALNNTPFLNIIGSTGKVGFGTDSPQETIHLVAGGNNFAGFRIEDTRGHWTISTGGLFEDLGFRIRDSGTGTTPFRIDTAAPTDSIRITANGNIGIGTATPGTALHVSKDTTALIRAENTSATAAERVMFQLINNGKTRFAINNTQAGQVWTFDNSGPSFDISRVGSGVAEFRLFNDGDATFSGNVTANGVVLSSSRALKTDFKDVEELDILDKVAALDIMEWRYKQENEGVAHIGPMAEDFRQIFGMGDGKTLNMVDTTGITFAAIQGLREEQRAEMKRLREENAEFRARIAEIDAIKVQLEELTADR